MRNFYIYRYVDKNTKEIMYIGKTGRLTVEERINQHITDNIGVWAKNNPHTIEFIELPKEEDMNYIESYLIRKYTPKCNIMLMDGDLPPFKIEIDENLWKSYEDYIEEKKHHNENMMKISQANVASNISEIMSANKEFDENLIRAIHNIDRTDKDFIRFLLTNYSAENGVISLPKAAISMFYRIEKENNLAIDIIIKRLCNIQFYGKIRGTMGQKALTQLFVDITKDETKLTFYLGNNHQYFIKELIKP